MELSAQKAGQEERGQRETDRPVCDLLSLLIYDMHTVQNQHGKLNKKVHWITM